MKFKVREGFIVHDVRLEDNGDGTKSEVSNTYPAGKVVEFDAETAALHAHKLEPIDDAATKFLESKHRDASLPTEAVAAMNPAAIAAVVAATLAAMGITPGLAAATVDGSAKEGGKK